MNKNFYKTIFSQSRGEMIAVAENASVAGQRSNGTVGTNKIDAVEQTTTGLALKVLSFSMLFMTGAVAFSGSTYVHAGIVADANVAGNQRPIIVNAANGTTQVNIQTPTQAGVSMNQYQQFDVNQKGVILNNSRQNTQTQLAGYIQGNPWLAGGEAKVIVNQVNSSHPSHLNGYVEVGGRRADVIIANQAGISVDGGGFINASRVTLSTGNPLLNNGQVTGFQIRDGVINITGKGLDTSQADYTQLLSRAAQINAGVWAKDLQVVTGQNDIDANQKITAQPSTNSTNTPQFAIDTGSLGGMYAGKISLISTEKGIGINNAGQVFASAGNIHISADGQLNNTGAIVAQDKTQPNQATLNIQAQNVNNSGSISSLGQQNIQSRSLTNTGLIATSAELNIRNQDSLQNQGDINAGRLDIETQQLNNQSGNIVQTGLQDLSIQAKTLTNTNKGLIGYTELDSTSGSGGTSTGTGQTGTSANTSAPSTATGGGSTSEATTAIANNLAQGNIKADSIQNDAGKITANGGVDLDVTQSLDNAGTLNLNRLSTQGDWLNNQGLIRSQDIQSHSQNLNNQKGQIYSNTAMIRANQLDNRSGLIQAQQLEMQIAQQLDNRTGQLSAQDALTIHDAQQNTLKIDNTESGKILSAGDLQLQSKALLHTDGSSLMANRNLSLKQQDGLMVDGAIQAGQNLNIVNANTVLNNNHLEAGNQLSITAQQIKNNANAVIQANQGVDLSTQHHIENTGLINSNGLTRLVAGQQIINQGTGQIYGNHIALQAQELHNIEQQDTAGTTSASIAARNRLDIGVSNLENKEQSLISSEGQLAIGGQLNANNLAEGSAQLVDNASARIQSAGDMSISTDTLTNRNLHFSASLKEVENSRKKITAYQGNGSNDILDSSHVTGWGGQETVYLDGHQYEDYTRYKYTQYEKQTSVDSSAPAYIISGGNLTLDGKNLVNDKSQILAAQGITIEQNDIENVDATGEHRLIQNGTSRYHYVGWNKLHSHHKSKWNSAKPYNPADVVIPIDLGVVKKDEHYTGAINSAQIQHVQTQNVDDKTQTEIRTTTPDLSLPTQSLFSVNKDNNNAPLIETNSAFTQYKKWLGSDYMLGQLNADPANMHKRLGDGYYEQRLISDQIAQLTGKVYLEGYSNQEAQYKALMDAGVSAAKTMKLTPGIELSEAQIARLTSDIVWLVTQNVTLADGQKVSVLVPKVYALVQTGDLNGQGTLIAANTVNMQLNGNLNNTATIAGRQLVNLTSNNINNVGGLIQGQDVYVQAKHDIQNIGGTIAAEKTLVLDAGNNINIASTTMKTENKQGSSEFTAENLSRKAGLYVTGQEGKLIAQAKHDITLQASDVSSQGSVAIQAGDRLKLSTVNVSRKDLSSAGRDDYVMHASSKDVGTQIQAQGDIQLKSGANTEITAGTLNSSKGNVVVDAGKNIEISNGHQTNESAMQTQEQGAFGSTTKIKNQFSSNQSLANNIQAKGNIVIHSQSGDIQATHLQAAADNNIQIQAEKGNIALLSALDDKRESLESSKKGIATYSNRQSGYINQKVAQTSLKAGNSVDINAAKNIELQANDVQAGNSIYVGNTLMQRQADGSLKAADGSLMPENVTLSTLATKDEQWDEQQKGYRGIAKELVKGITIGAVGLGFKDPVKVGESKAERTEQTQQQGTSLQANNIAVGSTGQTTLTSSDLNAKNISLSGQKVTLNAAEEQSKHSSSQGEETIQGLGVKLNKDSLRLGGFKSEDTTQSTTTTTTTHKSGQINTENLNIQGAEGIDILGQNVKATGDTVLDHGRGELNIGGYENKTVTEEKTHTKTVTSEVGVRNAYLDAALAIIALKDATKALNNAKKDYSQAQKDYAAGKITKDALDDSKANLAMATINLATAEIAVGAAAASAAASTATYGFTIGANGERIETTSTSTTAQGQWQGSTFDLNNLTLKSEGQNANIQGSRLTATGTTSFDGTKDLNITAGTEHNSQSSNSKTNSQSVSYTYGGGGSASIGKQTSKSESNSLTHVNSEVTLNKTEGSLNSLNIKGGEVTIQDRGNLQVNNIHVESLQDTSSSSNSSRGGSLGGGYGSGSANVTASYNQSKGSSDSAWVNNTSKLLIGDGNHDANLDAMGVKNVTNIGGVIANATKNADETLTDHKNLNYTGNLELKDLQDHNYNKSSGFNVSTNIGVPQKGSKAASTAPKGSTTIGLNSTGQETEQLTKATMGQGTVTNAATGTNRNINNTQEITRDQTTGMLNGSVTVDHRLLTERGRAEIVKEQKDIPENFRQSAEN
ncbi:hemagglutinin repeat-containing protein, partial [Acinetobacter sp. MD2(2019)]|uniref:two-partner secretion domain-containing protein n=1 Tax=Acinetobacter sp. MD2(2019) TaxID=2605273 RepID=UPI002D1E57E7